MFSHCPNVYHDAVVRQVKEMTLPAIQTTLGFESVDHASRYVIRIEPSPESSHAAVSAVTRRTCMGFMLPLRSRWLQRWSHVECLHLAILLHEHRSYRLSPAYPMRALIPALTPTVAQDLRGAARFPCLQ
jgi:hypothetical protein